MSWGKKSERGSAVAWLALALAIGAVVIAVVAYYRSGGPPLEQEVAREVEEATTVLRSQIAEIERATEEARERLERRALATDAREALLAARARIEEQGDVEEIRRALERANDDLREMYDGQGENAGERWSDLRAELARANEAVGEDVNSAFDAVSAAIERVEREMRRQALEADEAGDSLPEVPAASPEDGEAEQSPST